MELRKATRQKVKVRIGFSATSGAGKTISALLMAYGMTGDWAKIAVIDTENNSADLYANHTLPNGITIGEFQVLSLSAPYHPKRYIEAIGVCVNAGVEVLIVDSITHEWDGRGGCLEIIEELTQKDPKHNSYTQWAKVTPLHQDFIDAILQAPCHVFTTVRRKQDYDMSNQNGKTVITKAGLKEVTRDGFEYELTANLELDMQHHCTAQKDRTGLFADKPAFIPSIETGKMLLDWCELGVDPNELLNNAISGLTNASSIEELSILKDGLPEHIKLHPRFKEAGLIRYNQLKPAA